MNLPALRQSIAAVIVNYGTSSYLPDLLESLVGQIDAALIVDNYSSVQERLKVERLVGDYAASPLVVDVLRMPNNPGFGAGVNAGIENLEFEHDIVWILNPDMIVTPGAASALASELDNAPDSIASPVIYWRDQSKFWFAGGSLDINRGSVVHWHVPLSSDMPFECNFLTGAAIMCKVSVWKSLGGFSQSLFLYWEDADLSVRARSRGIRLLVVPTSRVLHVVGGAGGVSRGRSTTYYYYLSRNRIVVCYGQYGRLYRLLSLASLVELARMIYRASRDEDRPLAKVAYCLRGFFSGVRLAVVYQLRARRALRGAQSQIGGQ